MPTKRKNLQSLKEELSKQFEDFSSRIKATKNEEELSKVLVEALASVTSGNQAIFKLKSK